MGKLLEELDRDYPLFRDDTGIAVAERKRRRGSLFEEIERDYPILEPKSPERELVGEAGEERIIEERPAPTEGEIIRLQRELLGRRETKRQEDNWFISTMKGVADRTAGIIGGMAKTVDTGARLLEERVPALKGGIAFRKNPEATFGFEIDYMNPKEWIAAARKDPELDLIDKARSAIKDIREGIDFEESTSWQDVKDSPTPVNLTSFLAQHSVMSAPDMLAVLINAPGYVVSLLGESAETRAKNDGRTEATTNDILAVMPSSILQAYLERLGAKTIARPGSVLTRILNKSAAQRTLKAIAIESGGEFIEESSEALAETIGTKKGANALDVVERGTIGAMVGIFTAGSLRLGAEVTTSITGKGEIAEGAISTEKEQIEGLPPAPKKVDLPPSATPKEETIKESEPSIAKAPPIAKRALRNLGYSDTDMKYMTPEEAQNFIDNQTVSPDMVEKESAKVKMMITQADRKALRDLGYTKEDISKMRPAEAQSILEAEKPPAPEVEEEIPTFPRREQQYKAEEIVKDVPVDEIDTIALKKEEIDQIRETSGLSELPKSEQRTWEGRLNEAKAKGMDSEAENIAKEIILNPRAVTDTEHAAMVLRVSQLKNEYNSKIADAENLINQGKVAEAQVIINQSNIILNSIDDLTNASDMAGREAARALNIRKMRMNIETYDLVNLIRQARVNKGSNLSPREEAGIRSYVKQIADAEKRLRQIEGKSRKLQEKISNQKASEAFVDTVKKTRRRRKQVDLLTERENLKDQLRKMGLRVNDITGLAPEAITLISKLAANHIEAGARTLNEVVDGVREDMPDLSERDVLDAFGGRIRGERKRVEKEITGIIRDLRSQANAQGEIEQILAGKRPDQKIHRKPSRELKQLRDRLNILRKEVHKTEANDARLKRIVDKINKVQDQIDNAYRDIPKTKTPEPESIRIARNELRDLRNLMKTQDKITDLETQLRTGDFKISPKRQKRVISEELDNARVKLSLLKKDVRNNQGGENIAKL